MASFETVTITYENIPLNWTDKVKEVEQFERFKKEVAFVRDNLENKEIVVAFQSQLNGAVLLNAAANDLWLYRSPEGKWSQAYIGYDDQHCQTVLTDDKYQRVFSGYIADFKEVLPIYIKKIQ
ncbi:hypothetical protein A7M79_00620 [Acinetobacter baumannii]|uniref:hypothetical protein n=1 Tax=Acinetobacter baumannii TaxID=470 RepID=UPI0008DE282D|nr:hypothetical protein [Acinetobacter baumannii]OIH12027.1 hypothetical protein A7M79_00620 [Acinetobacter baumannii]